MIPDSPIFLLVDLFCGFGGTTSGFADAYVEGNPIAKVIACVNHDPKAIKSHWMNHPGVVHFEEDIRTLDLTGLQKICAHWQGLYPDAYLILWASLECTNFSKAKGGAPRDADSRTLADHLPRYQKAINPDLIKIENVVEFMSWGPLDDKGKPLSRKNGQDWMRWREEMKQSGDYHDDWKELNSADYGAYTSRNRLFGCFAKQGLSITWPAATHSKKASMGMFNHLAKWKAVKDVLNFSDEGQSIFTRKKPLSEKTLERIYAGLIKFVANGDKSFISKYFSGKPEGKNISTDGPAGTVTTFNGQSLVQADFIINHRSGDPASKAASVNDPMGSLTTIPAQTVVQTKGICLLKYDSTDKTGTHYPPSLDAPAPVIITQSRLGLIQGNFLCQTYAANSKSDNTFSTENPGRTVTTRDSTQLVQPEFLAGYYGNGDNVSSVNQPCPTVPTKDRFGMVQPKYFINRDFKSITQSSVEEPAGTLTTVPKMDLVEAAPFIVPTNYDNQPKSIDEPLGTITANRKHHYIVNPSHGGNNTSTDGPCPVIIARQDKAPLYLIQTAYVVNDDKEVNLSYAVFDDDSEIMIKIKQFMAAYLLVDIKMRMLRVPELLRIQGFPGDYKMEGTQSDHKKFIGNSVVPVVVQSWAEAMAAGILEKRKTKVA